ncbi:ABC transporter ATP-binding protein [Corynebacterium humireducens NBRC 106098 = DSM 45392]|uniref:ABC transporter ATP-binding protein n=1 Tax=Corynebacterium humireducens NBRC 106098 = DSM 45392 TaxID=1223515 RepID=A0A0B5D4J6_9CORY|nr:ABC transporter ATP-binding protein [Corynebacterium humireducens]AJE33781.1 ABC transporter ATP-binding protein [Corynebacterium humireducens NBRC 106098 = DSM 45392]
MTILSVTGLRVGDGLLDDITFTVGRGERVGLIGESGSGKSLTALSIMGLLPRGLSASGSVVLDGQELIGLPDRRIRPLRGRVMSMVFQEPMTALDPLMTVGKQVQEAAHRSDVADLFEQVALDPARMNAYPHELSGGQRQRVLIAMALAQEPDLLICDEPTTALDVTVQDQILDLLDRLVDETGVSLLFITHDLGVINRMCRRVLVMSGGSVVEEGTTEQVLRAPEHPYTQRLIAASLPGAPAEVREVGPPVLTLSNVTREYGATKALDDVSLVVHRGERLGIVGGSGSGKTTLLRQLAGLDSPTSGTVRVDAGVQVVFQDPQSSLNPRLRVGRSVAEGGGDHARVLEVLAEVGLPPDAAERYPHQFSGGQRQRISIARAVAGRPEILLADEPVSALDVSVRAQVLELLDRLVDEYGLTLVFISHDLSVVREVCSTVAVMYRGRIVEHGPTEAVWADPQDEYTRSLLAAIPRI